jgi:hypothetical protein
MSLSIDAADAAADSAGDAAADSAGVEAAAEGAVEVVVPPPLLQAANTMAEVARRPAQRVKVACVVNVVSPPGT